MNLDTSIDQVAFDQQNDKFKEGITPAER